MKYNNMSGKLSNKSRRRSPSNRQRIVRARNITGGAGREIRVRGSV